MYQDLHPMHAFKPSTLKRLLCQSWIVGLCWAGGLGYSPSAMAVEQIKIKFGFLEQSISIRDLEAFAATGRISPSLKPLSGFLTPQIRQALTLQLPFWGGDRQGNSLFKALDNIPFLDGALPKDSMKELRSALSKAAEKNGGMSFLSILKAYPGETIDVDATMAVSLLAKLNPGFLGTQVVTPSLERELAITTPTFKPTFDPTIPGEQRLQRESFSFQDRDRKRSIPVELVGGQNAQLPLIVISHGLGADRTFLRYLGEHLASYGFTVAFVEHPQSDSFWVQQATSNNLNLTKVLPPNEFIDRPLDISFLLDELGRMNLQPGLWQGKLSTQQVTVIGHSLGATTALMLGGANLDITAIQQACKNRLPLGKAPAEWLQCAAADLNLKSWPSLKRDAGAIRLRDMRVAQVVALNPMIGDLFGASGLKTVATPVLMLASTEDSLTPALSQQFRPFQQLTTPKYLVTAIGGTHLSVGDPSLSGKVGESGIASERQGAAAEPLRKLMRGVTLAFVQQLTPQAQRYQPFLTPDYAQLLSQSNFPLRLSTELSANLIR